MRLILIKSQYSAIWQKGRGVLKKDLQILRLNYKKKNERLFSDFEKKKSYHFLKVYLFNLKRKRKKKKDNGTK